MAKMNNKTQKTTNGGQTAQQSEQEDNTVEIDKGQLDNIVERLDSLESENQELKRKTEPSVKSEKETYKGPKLFNYKMWDGKPVKTYVSTKVDSARPLVVRGQNGEYQSNHLLTLTFADGSTDNVDVNEFNAYFERSEKLEPKEIKRKNDEQGTIEGYVFEHPDYGEFVVDPKAIN